MNNSKSLSQNPYGGVQRPKNLALLYGFGTCSKHLAKKGFTAVEVMVSMLLASLLMVAMLSVLRGLKAQADALETRMPVQSWQRTLDCVLQFDLENSRTYERTHSAIILRGYAGHGDAGPTWKPATILYEIVHDKNRSWMVRRDLASPSRELVLADVTSLRIGMFAGSEIALTVPSATKVQPETPITNGLTVEFWGSGTKPSDQGGRLYGYRFRQP